MENLNNSDVNATVMMTNMIDNASKFWKSFTSSSSAEFKMLKGGAGINGDNHGNAYEAIAPSSNLWKGFTAGHGNEALLNEEKEGYDNLYKLLKFGLNGYSFFQKKWIESAKNIDDIFSMNKKETHSDSDIFKIYNEIYQKEFHKFFSVPSLGLSRGYQEKFQQLLDKSNIFTSALTEFMYFLYVPFEKSFKVVQDTLVEMAQTERLPEEQQDYYKMWIEQLEKHYISLFKSSEYIEALGNVVTAMSDFKAAQQQLSQDYFKLFGIPVEQDMDELYKDIYLLKKRIRTLENENKSDKQTKR